VVESTNGRFIVDAEGAAMMVESFERQGVQLVVDFEHQTLGGAYSAPDGRAPAAGWVTRIFYEVGRGVSALVKWNSKTREAIREGAYGYVSPVLIVRKNDLKAIGLHSVALTNKPAIAGLERIAASQNANADTTTKAVLVANAARKALGLNDDADADLVVASVTTLKARTAGVAAIETELAALKAQIHNQEAEQWVGAYSAKGVVGIGSNDAERKADREMILRMACSSRADCERVLQQRIAFLPPAGITNPPTGRQTTILEAEREFKGNPAHARSTSLQAFVANALREKGLPKLTEAETSELSIA
jgi:phage I-like protein